MFEDLLRRLGIGEFNSGCLLRRWRRRDRRRRDSVDEPGDRSSLAAGVHGVGRRLRAGR